MKKRNLITSVVALSLVSLLGIGATLAYLTDSAAATNTFTTGNVKIDLVEPNWDENDGQDLAPGDVIPKDPAIVNTGKNDAYMMIIVDGMEKMSKIGFEANYDDANWVLVDETGKAVEVETNALVDGCYVYVGDSEGVVAAGEATEPLFEEVRYTIGATGAEFGAYTIKGELNDEKNGVSHYEIWKDNAKMELAVENKFESYDEAADYIVSESGLDAADEVSYTFDLVVSGYGIQAENVTFEKDDIYGWVATLLNTNDNE